MAKVYLLSEHQNRMNMKNETSNMREVIKEYDEDELRRNFLKDYGLDEKDYDKDLYYEWYGEEMARISCSGLRWIRSRYSVDDQVSLEDLPEYTVDIPVDLVK